MIYNLHKQHLILIFFLRNNNCSPVNQLLTVLHFYVTCSHQTVIGDFMGMLQSTVSKIILKVSKEIATLLPNYVKMPARHELIHKQNKFFNISRFSKVIGCLDGTHIQIQNPGIPISNCLCF